MAMIQQEINTMVLGRDRVVVTSPNHFKLWDGKLVAKGGTGICMNRAGDPEASFLREVGQLCKSCFTELVFESYPLKSCSAIA